MLVRVALRRAPAHSLLRYSVDRGRAHPAALRFTIHDLLAGRHRLLVTLVGTRAVHASVTFFVRPVALPPPPPAPAPPPSTTTTTTTAPPPPPPPTTTTATTPPNPIPQNNGGDGDADNNGAPSDGDGNF